jgi:hypothetical protein
LTPTNRVSQSGHLSSPATEMPQYGQCLSIIPPGRDLVGCELQGYNLPIGPDTRKGPGALETWPGPRLDPARSDADAQVMLARGLRPEA